MKVSKQPLYLQIAQTLQREIPRRYGPGMELDVSELQQRFGVSALTLREALSVLVRQGFIERYKGRGTFVSARIPAPHVGIVSELDLFDGGVSFFYRRLTQMLRLLLHGRGVRVRLYIGYTQPGTSAQTLSCDDLADDLEHGQLSALVAVALTVPRELREMTRQAAVPVVSASSGSDGCVMLDHADFIRRALDELAAVGRRKIAILGTAGVSPKEMERFVKERGFQFHPGWLQHALHPSLPGAGWESFLTAWNAAAERPDGLLIADDMFFNDTASAILSQHIAVPHDLYVITHANRGAWRRPLIPAVRYEVNVEEVGRIMADMTLRLMRADAGTHEETILRLERVEPDSQHFLAPFSPSRTRVEINTTGGG